MTALRRLSSYVPPAPFVAGSTLTRITFAQVEGKEPVFTGDPPAFAVVVWPMRDGLVDVEAALRGEARATTWTPIEGELRRLIELLTDGWDLARGDVLVGGGKVIPQLESLRRSPYMPLLDVKPR